MKYSVLAYYVIDEVADPLGEVKAHKDFLKELDSSGRIYIGKEGVNAQLSLINEDLPAYLDWLKNRPLYKDADVKVHLWHEHAFAKLTVKVREQLVGIDMPINFANRGEYLSPKEWKEAIENRDENTIVIDVRNKYESDVGHFEGALLPDLDTFREFPKYAEDLKKDHDPKKTKVMMYCTGGIRCEYYSALMKDAGYSNVKHLKGGVIRYGMEEGSLHWKGKLIVFDDRLVVPISKDNTETISHCHFCNALSDTYYNCANMDCNDLFLGCRACIEKMKGCCKNACMGAPRLRQYTEVEHPKPFRKLSFEEKTLLTKD